MPNGAIGNSEWWSTILVLMGSLRRDRVKWYNYLACFFAGVFLIHILPHVMHGFSAKNVLGVVVSLGGGCLLLWAGRFSLRNPLAVVLVVLGMASVWVFVTLHPHHHDGEAAPTVSAMVIAGRAWRQKRELSSFRSAVGRMP